MRRLIAAVRAVVALPARATTTLADIATWSREQADQRALWASIDAAVAKARLIARTDPDPLVQSWAEVLRMPTDVADRSKPRQPRKPKGVAA